MTQLHQWKSGAAALMAISVTTGTIAPMMAFAPAANAQYRINDNRIVSIPAGVSFPVSFEKEKINVEPGKTSALTLKIANNIIDNNRNILIPANTEVVGQLQPVYYDNYSQNSNDKTNVRGVQFVARELVFPSGRRQAINASSQTVTRMEKITRSDSSKILTDAAIGAGAATVISLITGNRRIEVLEPVAGAVAGGAASALLRKKSVDVFVVRPDQDLRLTLNSNLTVDVIR